MKLAVIPARGGSKRIPRKNIQPFGGKPMIAWSIEAARQSQCFDRIIVSTDDLEIAQVARDCGAEVPFVRPASLADDHTGTAPVVRHAIAWQNESGEQATQVCCIYATAPFVQAADLCVGLAQLEARQARFVFSATSYPFPIQRAFRIRADGQAEMFHPELYHTRSQDLEPAWHDAGQFYWGQAQAWMSSKPLFSDGAFPMELPRHRVQDIDNPEDWRRAEWMFKAQRLAGSWPDRIDTSF